MITEISKAQLLALHCGRLKDAGLLDAAHVSMLKRNNATMAIDCARLSRGPSRAAGITGRLSGHAAPLQPQNRPYLRRNRSHPRARHRRTPSRHSRLALVSCPSGS